MTAVLRRSLADVDATMPGLARFLYSQIRRELGHRVIDAGAGVGLFTRILSEDGRRVVALEGDPELLVSLRSRVASWGEVYSCDLAATSGLPSFDACDSAICINVAEHIRDDRRALVNLRQRVVPGGRLVILVPAHPWLYNELDRAIGHYRRYTRESLERLVAESGWKLESTNYFNALSILPWFVTGSIFRRGAPGSSLIRLGGGVMPLITSVDRYVTRGRIGISLVAIATNEMPVPASDFIDLVGARTGRQRRR
jgi:SAM-dependent methyltransferase